MKKKILITIAILLIVALLVILFVFLTKEKTYKIPRVYFEGDISNMTTKKDERNITINYVSDDINFKTNAKIKIQGTSSIKYEKKNYSNINSYFDIMFFCVFTCYFRK